MDDRLKRLKEDMDNTVLNTLDFREENKSKVRKAIYKSKKNKKIKNLYPRILSVGFTCIFIMGISYFGFIHKEKSITDQSQPNKEQGEQESISHLDSSDKDFIYTPSKQEENYSVMTKKEILTKMLNSVDNFETAKGEYEIHYANSGDKRIVNYELSIRENSGGVSQTKFKVNGKDTVRSDSYKDVYIEEPLLSIEDAFTVDEMGIPVTRYRWRPPTMAAFDSLFPYEIASNYTRDLSLWDIEKQNEKLLGHNTLVIKGILNNYASKKGKANTFRFWVDKDSGVLVKYETYNSNGEVVDYLHPIKMEINIPVDTSKFK